MFNPCYRSLCKVCKKIFFLKKQNEYSRDNYHWSNVFLKWFKKTNYIQILKTVRSSLRDQLAIETKMSKKVWIKSNHKFFLYTF